MFPINLGLCDAMERIRATYVREPRAEPPPRDTAMWGAICEIIPFGNFFVAPFLWASYMRRIDLMHEEIITALGESTVTRLALLALVLSAGCEVYDSSLLVAGEGGPADGGMEACSAMCGTLCVDLQNDKNNCGACNHACETGCAQRPVQTDRAHHRPRGAARHRRERCRRSTSPTTAPSTST